MQITINYEEGMNLDNDPMMLSARLEKALGVSRETLSTFPWIQLPPDYEFCIIFPFAGAAARFRVRKIGSDKDISVYLDVADILGYFGEPYWEAYPIAGDTYRCKIADTKELIEVIVNEIEGTPQASKCG